MLFSGCKGTMKNAVVQSHNSGNLGTTLLVFLLIL